MKHLIVATTLLVTAAFGSSAGAQVVAKPSEDSKHILSVRTGFNSAVATTTGYAYQLSPGTFKKGSLLYGELTVPVGALNGGSSGLSDSSVHLGLRTTLLGDGNFRLQAEGGPALINEKSRLFTAHALGLHAALLPGYQSNRWGLMAELGYEKMLATRLGHSDLYKDTFYSGAEDGWYRNTAGTARLGIRAGVRFGTTQVTLRAGAITTERGNPHLPPFYATIGASYGF